MRPLCLVVMLGFLVPPVYGQVQSRPADPPLVTAENDEWYLRGDPVQFAGNTYFRAGAAVFFDGNRMVRSGYFLGVPLYADTTMEPFSAVFVPVGRGLMQPYERPRAGDLAGTTGSHAPSFPVSALPDEGLLPVAPGPPTSQTAVPLDSQSAAREVTGQTFVRLREAESGPEQVAAAVASRPPLRPADIEAARERVWVEYRGQRWVSAGPAIPFDGSGLVRSGERGGFPVFTRSGEPDRIYLPALQGLVTPYRLKR